MEAAMLFTGLWLCSLLIFFTMIWNNVIFVIYFIIMNFFLSNLQMFAYLTFFHKTLKFCFLKNKKQKKNITFSNCCLCFFSSQLCRRVPPQLFNEVFVFSFMIMNWSVGIFFYHTPFFMKQFLKESQNPTLIFLV